MVDVFLSSRFLLVDLEDISLELAALEEAGNDLRAAGAGLAAALDGLEGLAIGDIGSEAIDLTWANSTGDGVITITGTDFVVGFSGIRGAVDGFEVEFDGRPLFDIGLQDDALTLELAGVRATLNGAFETDLADLLQAASEIDLTSEDTLAAFADLFSADALRIDRFTFADAESDDVFAEGVLDGDVFTLTTGPIETIVEANFEGDLTYVVDTILLNEDLIDSLGSDLGVQVTRLTVIEDGRTLADAVGDLATMELGDLVVRGRPGVDQFSLFGNVAETVTVRLRGGDDDLVATSRGDLVFGQNGADKIAARGGADTVFGGAGSDTLLGGQGRDKLDGGGAGDLIVGEAGNDTLIGGLGRDTFEFGLTFGQDRIVDFLDNRDTLALDPALWAPAGDLSAAEVVDTFGRITPGGAARLRFDADTMVTFIGVDDPLALINDIVFV